MDENYEFSLPEEFGVEEVLFLDDSDCVANGGTVSSWEDYADILEQFRYPKEGGTLAEPSSSDASQR